MCPLAIFSAETCNHSRKSSDTWMLIGVLEGHGPWETNNACSHRNPCEPFAEAFNEVQRIQALRSRASPLQILVSRASFRRGLKVVDELCDIYIDEALQLSQEELATKTKSDHDYTFLHELAQFTRDRTVLRDQLVAVLLAGRDTTAATLSVSKP